MARRPHTVLTLSDAEWKVMRALWAKQPATARELLVAVAGETNWAYTTIKTVLARLVEKGAVREEKDGATSVYRSQLAEKDARKSAVRGLLSRAFDGGFGSLVHFMLESEELDARDRAELARLVAEAERAAPKRKGGKR